MKYVKDDKREQIKLEKRLRQLQKSPHVAVGILQDEVHDEHFSMVDLAMVHEYGSRDGHIPQRSFIRSSCDTKKKDHIKLIGKLQSELLAGHMSTKQALTIMGEVVAKDMAQIINHGIEPGLAAATIKRKGSSKPLIDTGRLKGSITHEVRGGA